MVVRGEEVTKIVLSEISTILIESTAVSLTASLIEPVIEEKFDPDRTILTLEFKKKSGDKKATKKSDDKKATKKSDGKKVTKKTQAQYDKILDFMEFDKEYSLQEFCELLDLKETRTKAILKQLNEYIEPIGSTKNRKYLRKK